MDRKTPECIVSSEKSQEKASLQDQAFPPSLVGVAQVGAASNALGLALIGIGPFGSLRVNCVTLGVIGSVSSVLGSALFGVRPVGTASCSLALRQCRASKACELSPRLVPGWHRANRRCDYCPRHVPGW